MKTMNHDTVTPKQQSIDNLNQHVQDLRRDAGSIAQDVKDHATARVNEVKDTAVAKFNDAKDQAASRLQDVKDQANARLENAKATASDLVDSGRTFVREHPFTALGVGVVLGLILASRWSKKSA